MEINRRNKPTIEDVRKIVEKDGAKGWSMAKEVLLKQETNTPQLKQALTYLTLIPDYYRPAIVSYCCEAVGGKPEITVPTAASLILLAKAIGIHDDIIDNVKRRKKHITVFGKFGKEIALILSDILLFKGFTLMRKNLEMGVSPETFNKILETIERVWFEQSESEILEHQFRARTDILPEDCLNKIRKRAAEFETITRIGAILGRACERDVESLATYGRCIGVASILRDELIDMLELEVLKHRIKRESLPLPLIYVLNKADAKSNLNLLISQRRIRKSDLIEVVKNVDAFDGMEYVAEIIDKVVDNASASISRYKRHKLLVLAESLRIYPHEWKAVLEVMSTTKLCFGQEY
ncbi:MAG: polyprenyl synthetase family protein [Candidatus Bathyarchaeia archaeon]